MTTIFDEESDEAAAVRFETETAEVDEAIQGEAIPPGGDGTAATADESIPLESLVTPKLCGLLLSIPGAIRARQTGHEFWQLDEEEKSLLGEASHPLAVFLVRKYLGESIGMFTSTAVALMAVYGPREMREQQLKRKARGEEGPQPLRPNPPTSQAASPPSSASGDAARASNSDSFSVLFQE
jgi:hypothetical protein